MKCFRNERCFNIWFSLLIWHLNGHRSNENIHIPSKSKSSIEVKTYSRFVMLWNESINLKSLISIVRLVSSTVRCVASYRPVLFHIIPNSVWAHQSWQGNVTTLDLKYLRYGCKQFRVLLVPSVFMDVVYSLAIVFGTCLIIAGWHDLWGDMQWFCRLRWVSSVF